MLVMFGVGDLAETYDSLLDALGIEYSYFVDNDKKKWGQKYCGKIILSPAEMTDLECRILISCIYVKEITEQLRSLGIEDRIIGLEELYKNSPRLYVKPFDSPVKVKKLDISDNVIFDIYGSNNWAGTELWAMNLAEALEQRDKKVCLFVKEETAQVNTSVENKLCRISEEQVVRKMIGKIEERLPCTIISNFGKAGFLASILAKFRNPGQIRIVAVLHCDDKRCFDRHMIYEKYIDAVFGVSKKIEKEIKEMYSFHGPVYSVTQSLKTENTWKRPYEKKGILCIGYAARLVKEAKRADEIPRFIQYLENRCVKYRLQIAGSGECEDAIRTFVKDYNLENKVQLLGQLPREKMNDFWKEQDIIINVSEYEGNSLALLEAMSYGCVPVVTHVSGVDEVIEDGKNGYICAIGDMEGMAEKIQILEKDYQKRVKFSKLSRESIEKNCDYTRYVEYWLNYIIGLGKK